MTNDCSTWYFFLLRRSTATIPLRYLLGQKGKCEALKKKDANSENTESKKKNIPFLETLDTQKIIEFPNSRAL